MQPSHVYNSELLKEFHILTREGNLNQDSKRKLKQIDHFGQLCFEQLLKSYLKRIDTFSVCDVGAGKNYFSFLMWDKYLKPLGKKCAFYNLESRQELNTKSKLLAQKIGLENFYCLDGNAKDNISQLPEKIDFLMALHACDTATDEAILVALEKKVPFLALVPCCQAEISRLLELLPKSHNQFALWRHPLHQREFGSHLTNVIRNLVLESFGYKVRCTEFTGLEHSLKNEVILAEKVQGSNGLARRTLKNLLATYPLEDMFLLKSLSIKFMDP